MATHLGLPRSIIQYIGSVQTIAMNSASRAGTNNPDAAFIPPITRTMAASAKITLSGRDNLLKTGNSKETVTTRINYRKDIMRIVI